MKRNCDNCGKEYSARSADVKRGWGLNCSKSCAASSREKSKDGYDEETVKKNNMKRTLWNNKYRKIELKLRKKYPKKTDEEIWLELYKITQDEIFLSKEVTDMFIF